MKESTKDLTTLKEQLSKSEILRQQTIDDGRWPQKLRAARVSEWIIDRLYKRHGGAVNSYNFQDLITRIVIDDQKYGIGFLAFGRSQVSSDHDISSLCTRFGFEIENELERQRRFAEGQTKIGIKAIGSAVISIAIAAASPPVILIGTVGGSAIMLYYWLFNK